MMKKIVGTIECHRCGMSNGFYGMPKKSVYCVCGCGLEKENYARAMSHGVE